MVIESVNSSKGFLISIWLGLEVHVHLNQ